MDTSEQYIRQCDCPEIQETIHDWRDRKSWSALIEERDEFIWLPRQDQIQEMMYKSRDFNMMSDFYHFWKEEECMNWYCDSQEKAWLCFYMCVNHHKIWGKDGWKK